MKRKQVKAKATAKQLQRMEEAMDYLTPDVLAELERIWRISSEADGFPAGGSGGGSTETSDPTLSAVIRRLTLSTEHDPRGRAAEIVAKNVEDAGRLLMAASRAARYCLTINRNVSGREVSIGECDACERVVAQTQSDRLRTGLCSACYARWNRTRDANGERRPRQLFIRDVQVEMTVEAAEAMTTNPEVTP
jgi:hypothetical protein